MKEIILKILKTVIIICIALVFSLTLLKYGYNQYYQYENINNPGIYLYFEDFKGPVIPKNKSYKFKEKVKVFDSYKFKEKVKVFDNNSELRILIIINFWIIALYLSFKEWERF